MSGSAFLLKNSSLHVNIGWSIFCLIVISCFLQFANAHGSSEITTLAQDATETRLFTASADGTVKVQQYCRCYNLEGGPSFARIPCGGTHITVTRPAQGPRGSPKVIAITEVAFEEIFTNYKILNPVSCCLHIDCKQNITFLLWTWFSEWSLFFHLAVGTVFDVLLLVLCFRSGILMVIVIIS